MSSLCGPGAPPARRNQWRSDPRLGESCFAQRLHTTDSGFQNLPHPDLGRQPPTTPRDFAKNQWEDPDCRPCRKEPHCLEGASYPRRFGTGAKGEGVSLFQILGSLWRRFSARGVSEVLLYKDPWLDRRPCSRSPPILWAWECRPS